MKAGDLPEAAKRGTVTQADVFEDYGQHVLSFLRGAEGRRLKVVVDAANGMGTIDRPILEAMNIELIPLFFELDGTFPNHEANPLREENLHDLMKAVREPGKMASWVAPPSTGIHQQPVDFDYVRV